MKPSPKSKVIDNFAKTLGFDRKEAIISNKCVICKKEADLFKDELSVKEYKISGLCQECQDRIFT